MKFEIDVNQFLEKESREKTPAIQVSVLGSHHQSLSSVYCRLPRLNSDIIQIGEYHWGSWFIVWANICLTKLLLLLLS